MGIYDFEVNDNAGNSINLSAYKDKVLLVVNTATGCGFTPQYEGLESLYKKYKEQGLEILDFPCNQFGNQAPENDAQIQSFCTLKYDTTFPRFQKCDVNGKNALPLYNYLKKQKSGLFGSNIKWNFTKFLIDRNRNVVARFAPTKKPEDIEAEILKLL